MDGIDLKLIILGLLLDIEDIESFDIDFERLFNEIESKIKS